MRSPRSRNQPLRRFLASARGKYIRKSPVGKVDFGNVKSEASRTVEPYHSELFVENNFKNHNDINYWQESNVKFLV